MLGAHAVPRRHLHALDAFVDELEQLDDHFVALGVEVAGVVLDRPRVADDEARGLVAGLVLHADRDLLALLA